MSKCRTFSLALALALAALTPQAAFGSGLAHEAASPADDARANAPAGDDAGGPNDDADVAADAEPGTEGEAGEARRPKRGGNAFARALAAPFRALARLFGGGRKSKAEAAKKSAPAPAPAVTQAGSPEGGAAVTGGAPQPPAQAEVNKAAPAVSPAQAPPAAPREDAEVSRAVAGVVAPQAATAAPAESGTRVVRPSAGGVVEELRPRMWVPLIVGVPADHVSQGRALLERGHIQEAIAELQTAATTVGPQLAEANNLLGVAYDRLGWHRQAAEAYGRALAVSPKDFVALANLGYSLYLADDYAGALKRLRQAARLAPGEPVILNNLGIVHARLGKYGEAYKNFARASNEYEAHLKLAGVLEDLRRDREAVKHYEAALRLQPGASAVLERLVAVYERTGARDKAESARRALGRPRNPQKTATGGGG